MLKYRSHLHCLFSDASFTKRTEAKNYLKHPLCSCFYCVMNGQWQPHASRQRASTQNSSWQLPPTQHTVRQQPSRQKSSWQQPPTTQFASWQCTPSKNTSWQQSPTQNASWQSTQPQTSTNNPSHGAAPSVAHTSAYHIKQIYIRGSPSNRTSPSASMKRYYRAERPLTSEERRNSRIEQLLNHRWLEYTNNGNAFYRSLDSSWQEFSLATYNVLAQNLLEGNIYLYRHCSDEFLQWEYRRRNLLTELKRLNADILCLQEVVEEHFKDFFEPKLQKFGYDAVYKKKTDPNAMDGCAIFYKRSKFSCLGVHPVEYYDPNVKVLDRHNVGLIIHLRCRRLPNRLDKRHRSISGELSHHADICVATTHLLFNPKRGDVKLAQVMKLFAAIDEVARKASVDEFGTHCPVMMCGDMNSTPYSDMYRFIRNGQLNCDETVVPQMCARPDDLGISRGRVLSRDFLSANAGISDNCQRMSNLQQENCRLENDLLNKDGTLNLDDEQRPNTSSLTSIKQSSDINAMVQSGETSAVTQGSGIISHPFSLRSVYAHDAQKKIFDTNEKIINIQEHCDTSESTTCHCSTNDTCDYIFYTPYNRVNDDHSVSDGKVSNAVRYSASSMNVDENTQSQNFDNANPTLHAEDKTSINMEVSQPSSSNNVIVIDDSNNSSCASNQQSGPTCGASSNRSAEQLRLLSRLRLPTVKEMKFIGGLPNSIASSDHVPLFAVFAVKLQSDNERKTTLK